MNPAPIVVSLAWGDAYQPLADRLEKDAKAAGLISMITRQPGASPARGVDAWRKKPALLAMAQTMFQRPVLWIDIDFEICWAPALFRDIDADVAAYTNGFKKYVYEDGVVWFNNTELAQQTLVDWMERCAADDLTWSHHALSASFLKVSPKLVDLPPTYHWVERWKMPEQFGKLTPIIRENPLKKKDLVTA